MKSHVTPPFFIREAVVRAIRAFFEDQGFHEVISPVLNEALPLEPTIYPFTTEWQTSEATRQLYLTTSPESSLKKMLGAGLENCFAVGKCFRNLEGAGSRHNPEFLMLEWYRKDATYEQIMQDTQELFRLVYHRLKTLLPKAQSSMLTYQDIALDLQPDWPVLSLEQLCATYAGVQLTEATEDEQLRAIAQQKHYQVEGATWEQLFDQIFLNEIEPNLPKQPFFLIDFPARISPLCAVQPHKPYLAQRFEGYVAGMEICNGNTEQTDAKIVKDLMVKEQQHRQKQNQLTAPIDQDFLDALEHMSSTSYAGSGLGVDRLAMLFANTDDIKEVEYFCV